MGVTHPVADPDRDRFYEREDREENRIAEIEDSEFGTSASGVSKSAASPSSRDGDRHSDGTSPLAPSGVDAGLTDSSARVDPQFAQPALDVAAFLRAHVECLDPRQQLAARRLAYDIEQRARMFLPWKDDAA